MSVLVALLALGTEWVIGYPRALLSRIGHPVMWMGALLAALENPLNRPALSGAARRRNGVLALLLLLAATLAVALGITVVARSLPFGWVLEALVAASLLAGRQLLDSVEAVRSALTASPEAGRDAVSAIVGRDVTALDASGVCRAAMESLAENTSDGLIAPLFYLALFGLPGIALYKAINTADSMIGHRNTRYEDFGRAAARTDDLANILPARLTALLIGLAAALKDGANASQSLRTAMRDAGKHRSPNAGWPEAAMAGALVVSLGGPRSYGSLVVDLPWLGQGRKRLTPTDIERALSLYRRVVALTGLTLALIAGGIALVG